MMGVRKVGRVVCSVFGESLLTVSEKLTWSACLTAIAERVQYLAGNVYVQAICHVDAGSGIPEYPITGNVIFAQLVTLPLSD